MHEPKLLLGLTMGYSRGQQRWHELADDLGQCVYVMPQ